MAPEQITASRKVDARADIWSLGVILYQLLADTVPFPGKSIPDVHQAIRSGQWIRLSEHCENVPRQVDELVARSLESDRETRLPSVLAFAIALAPFGGPVAQESLARMQRVEAHRSGLPPRPIPHAGSEEVALDGTTIVDKRPPAPLPAGLKTAVASRPTRHRWMLAAVVAITGGIPLVAWVSLPRDAEPPAVTGPTPTPSASSAPTEAVAPVESSVPSSIPSASAEVAPSPAPPAPRAKPACKGTASAECEEACRVNVRDCEKLAIALAHGRGAPRNTSRARTLYEAACDAGSMSACSSAGALYAIGDGVTRNDDKAIELYSRACNGNDMIGCVNLGGIYFDDDGPRRDEKRGVDLYRRACNAGEANGCRNLCIAYRTHRGVDPNERVPRVCEAKPRGI
jgi:hypothetical protein